MKDQFSVVFIADVPQVGGASACLAELVAGLTRDWNVRCTVLLSNDGPLVELLEAAGAKTYITGHRAFLVSRPGSTYKIIPKYVVELVRYLINRRRALRRANHFVDFSSVDIIHSNLPRNDLGMMLSAEHGIPHICHLREYSFEHFRCWSYRRHPAEYISGQSCRLVAVSKACGDAWVERGVDRRKLNVVYDGVDVSAFQPSDPRVCSGDNLSMVFLGGYGAAKGILDAIGAVKVLKDRGYSSISLDVFGIGGERDIARARSVVKRFGIAGQVALHDAIENVSEVLPNYDIGLVCSTSEAFGRVVIEYFASGVAVVAASRGSIPELLENEKYGLLYDKQKGATSLADSIERLICNDQLLEAFRLKGIARARDFTVDKSVSAMARIYKEIVNSRL